ncbi:MAG: leucyl aminopeptidase [Xanthomonadales bacterium]|nr:leucyl aminopeptidase [Xanthomonadales bacterium]NIX12204.1 leucyl aminopeptidase [Xanthomonadales bacterium]
MKFSLSNTVPHEAQTPCLVIGVAEDAPLEGAAADVDRASDGLLGKMLDSGDIDPNRYNTTLLHGVPGVAAERVLVVGCGMPEKFDRVRFDRACLAAGAFLREHAVTEAHICLHDMPVEDLDEPWKVRHAAVAFDRANYLYTTTKALKDDSPTPLREAVVRGGEELQAALDQAAGIAAGYRRARELGNLPANICNPAYLAQQACAIADQHDHVEVEILKKGEMAEMGMDALLGVAQGSDNDPRLIILRHRGAAEDERPYILVGKGITFDTGGISLKPGPNMDQMKFDMCGAASVIGAFEACAILGLPINVIAVVAAAENMPDGKAYRPGDVVTSMSGKTIEILNTDAEGRLVLCDALTYCERFEPAAIVDVATLTGACVVALGHHASGLMSPHDDLVDELLAAGLFSVDRAWRLPLWEDYRSQLKTPFADMKNVGGMPAGSITAGCFLESFAKKMRWAHLDIAGSAWKWGKAEGATGRPVGLLTQFLIDRAG